MSRHTTGFQESAQEGAPILPLPDHHVLQSGAVLFPGAFDQHGCPLIVFPVEGQFKLSSQLSKAEVVDFINYFLSLHNKKQEKESLVSVVADLRHASLPTVRFIAETLLLLELHKPTVHSVYMMQPKKKDIAKVLLKLLAPSKPYTTSFKKVLLKETSELSNYIDRSQLTAQLGGYFVYCHQSWVAFIKEMDAFVQEFLSVVERLPSCISTLQALSRLQLPSSFSELQHFCSTNEAKFQQLRRELGLDDLLHHCEDVLQKLRHPETEPCYQAMAGTALYTHTAYEMLQNHSRITAAVEKVDLLWHQAFSKARLQLQVFQLREEALQITEQIKTLQEKLQRYKIEIAKGGAEAVMLVSEFKASIHTPAMALVRSAEDVLHTLAELLPLDSHSCERWAPNLQRLKDKLHSAVHLILQTLRAVSNYHYYYAKASSWYTLVLHENFLQELLSGLHVDSSPTHRQRRSWGSIPAWRHKMSTFLKKNPPPHMEELVHLAHLSKVLPDEELQQAGKQMSHRCTTLRKLLLSSGPVAVGHLQLALQWQYQLLRSSHVNASADGAQKGAARDACCSIEHESKNEEGVFLVATSASTPGLVPAEGKPASLSSFDSGFDGAGGSSQLEALGMRSTGTTDPGRAASSKPLIQTENISSVSDSEDHREEFDFGSVGNSSRASIQIVPRTTAESLNFEIQVKRSVALPSNPWLSLPVDDLENSYTVTITPNPTPQKRDPRLLHPLDPNLPNRSRDQPTQTEVLSSLEPRDWILDSQSTASLEDPDLSPIRNALSSTVTEGADRSMCTTEGVPTLLWDSYDLHDQIQDSVDGLADVSLKDWDIKEQEGLRQVEEILDRADEILEKEESVLAQEAVLDALLRSEDRQHQWPPWDSEEQHSVMSSSELAEAGVIGLEDYLDNEGAGTAAFQDRPDLLTELRHVQVLDELIMEENLRIQELRRSSGSPHEELSTSRPSDTAKERESFRLQLEKEKREVEKLEKSFDQNVKVKKHKDKVRKVVKCSVMEKAVSDSMEDRALCDEILWGHCNGSQKLHSLVDGDSQTQETCQTDMNGKTLGPDDAKEATTQDMVQLADGLCQDHFSEASPIVLDTTLIHTHGAEEPPKEEEMDPQGKICGTELESSLENAGFSVPKVSANPDTMPDNGAFDPGGISHPPAELKPTQALSAVNHSLAEQETPHSIEAQDPTDDPHSEHLDLQHQPLDTPGGNTTPAVCHNLVLNPNVMEHCNNNNNNHALREKADVLKDQVPEAPSEVAEEPSVTPDSVLKNDVSPAEALLPAVELLQRPPAPVLSRDPAPQLDTQDEGSSAAVRSSQATSTSGSELPGIQDMTNANMKEVMDFGIPIVLDTGSGLMKAGFANEDLPSEIFPTIIGTPKYEEIMNGDLERDTYIGHDAQHMRGVLALRRPIKNGIITNWDEMEQIWHHTFLRLRVDPEDHPVLLTEAAMNPVGNRQRMVEIMFECFNVPFTYVAMQAVLALYAAGRNTGVVFDSGDGVSHSVPVFEGYCLPHAVQRFPLAGMDVTMHLKKLLQEQGVSMSTTAEMEIVREMKEKCCCVALDYEAELSRGGSSHREMIYTMPDGQIVTLHTERFRAPEILFKPELIGRDHYGMHESIFKSILSSDIDLRRSLLGNIVLSGGNTLLDGLPERLQNEIKGLVPSDLGRTVRVISPAQRDFAVWSGGAVLANMPSFSSAWISQGEYEEYGPDIVYRKCF